MKRRILKYPSARPGDIGGPALPHIQVADEDDPAGETATNIYYYSKQGRQAAERIAREIAVCGVGIIYPCDHGVEIFPGELHRVIVIGQTAEAHEDE